jgi:small subunit ribosomal protein S3
MAEAKTTYGIIGIKVWIFRGEVLTREEEQQRIAVGV